jgi:hypothetical protein
MPTSRQIQTKKTDGAEASMKTLEITFSAVVLMTIDMLSLSTGTTYLFDPIIDGNQHQHCYDKTTNDQSVYECVIGTNCVRGGGMGNSCHGFAKTLYYNYISMISDPITRTASLHAALRIHSIVFQGRAQDGGVHSDCGTANTLYCISR